MSLQLLISCVGKVRGYSKADSFMQSTQSGARVAPPKQNGDGSHHGTGSKLAREVLLMLIRCVYDVRICKAYLVILLLRSPRFLEAREGALMCICELLVYTIRVGPNASLWPIARF